MARDPPAPRRSKRPRVRCGICDACKRDDCGSCSKCVRKVRPNIDKKQLFCSRWTLPQQQHEREEEREKGGRTEFIHWLLLRSCLEYSFFFFLQNNQLETNKTKQQVKFGGDGSCKEACVHRRCTNLQVRPPKVSPTKKPSTTTTTSSGDGGSILVVSSSEPSPAPPPPPPPPPQGNQTPAVVFPPPRLYTDPWDSAKGPTGWYKNSNNNNNNNNTNPEPKSTPGTPTTPVAAAAAAQTPLPTTPNKASQVTNAIDYTVVAPVVSEKQQPTASPPVIPEAAASNAKQPNVSPAATAATTAVATPAAVRSKRKPSPASAAVKPKPKPPPIAPMAPPSPPPPKMESLKQLYGKPIPSQPSDVCAGCFGSRNSELRNDPILLCDGQG